MNAVFETQDFAFLPSDNDMELVSPLQNQLLAALPDHVLLRLLPHLELCVLAKGTILAKPGLATDHFYFPVDCLISRHCVMEDDAGTAMSVVGNDGLIGIDLFMESGSVPTVSIVQIPGHAYRIDGARIREELDRHEELLNAMSRHFHTLLTQMAQTAVCNRHHTLEQQLCRWLLLSLDRMPAEQLRVTQDQISHALGVNRQLVAEVSRRLQKDGVLKCARGQITLLDRSKLEASSCTCYQVVARESNRSWLLGAPVIDSSLASTEVRHYH